MESFRRVKTHLQTHPARGEINVRRSSLLVGASFVAIAAAVSQPALAVSEPPVDGAFTVVLLPDTQNYADHNQPNLNIYYRIQTEWIAANVAKHNIKYVLHLGDITQFNRADEFPIARAAHDVLAGAGVPYAMTQGNHDAGPNGNGSNRQSLVNDDRFFGPNTPYAQQPSIGGFLGDPGTTVNSWHTFEAGGKKWMLVTLEWGPRDVVLEQVSQVIEQHPDHKVILATHAYTFNSGARYNAAIGAQNWNPHSYGVGQNPEKPNDGQQIWDKLLKKHTNIKAMLNGHVLDDGTGMLTSIGQQGQIIHQALSDYQVRTNGGDAWLRLMEFYPDGETVRVRTFSPALDRYDLTVDNDFTMAFTDRKVMSDHVDQMKAAEPKAYYQLSPTKGAAVANEGTLGAGLNATFSGPANPPAVVKPYKFDGASKVTAAGDIRSMRQWSVAAWVRTTSDVAGQTAVSLGAAGQPTLSLRLQPISEGSATKRWTAEFGTGASVRAKIQDVSNVFLNNWYHLVATSDGSMMRFYVNGHLVGEQKGSSLTLSRSKPVLGESLVGEIGEVAVFDRQISYGEIAQLHRSAFNRVIAGNLLNHAPTTDANNVARVTIVNQSFPGISIAETNRGDHEMFLGNTAQIDPQVNPIRGNPAIAGDGVMLSTVRQNRRDNISGSVEVGWNSFGDGVLSLSTTRLATGAEININTAVAWFSFVDGWTVAHVKGDGTLVHGNTVVPKMIRGLPLGERGRSVVDLGVNSETAGMLFMVGAANANRLVAAQPRPAGAGWDVKVVDNAAGNGLDGEYSFVYLRSDLENLTAGVYDGAAATAKRSIGQATVTRQSTGRYLVTIPGETAETGMLILSAADVSKVAALSFEADANGNFVVQSLDPRTANPIDTVFNWAFISFENPIKFKGSDNLGEPNIVLPPNEMPPPIDPLNFATACIDTYHVGEDRNSIYESIENGKGFSIIGNGWKRLQGAYTITSDTILDFEFSSSAEGEVHGIGFDNQDFMTENRSFKVHGTQAWGIRNFDNYDGSGQFRRYVIPVGTFYTGNFNKLFFVHDRDAAPVNSMESKFRNIKVYKSADAATAQPIQFARCDIKTHGGTQQDFGTAEVLDAGTTIKVTGNSWKRADVPYVVTPSTVLEFEFRSTPDKEGEVHGIGLDNNNVGEDEVNRIFMVYGVQSFGNTTFNDYPGDGQWKKYRIPVGQYYTGPTYNIFFVNDDDRPNPVAEGHWRNVRVFEGNVTN
jgi:hypothetical protein